MHTETNIENSIAPRNIARQLERHRAWLDTWQEALDAFPALDTHAHCWHGLGSVTFYPDLGVENAGRVFGVEGWSRHWNAGAGAFDLRKEWNGISITLYAAIRWMPADTEPRPVDIRRLVEAPAEPGGDPCFLAGAAA